MAYMILRILQASDVKTNTLLQRNFTIKQRNQTVIFVSLKRFPQRAKMLHMSLQCEFFLKAPL